LVMHFGRGFLFVVGKAASISWTLREKFLLWSPEHDSADSLYVNGTCQVYVY
jgi:hypothetical protein